MGARPPKTRVLLAEDDPDIRVLVELQLLRLDCEVTIAASGTQAARLARGEPFELVILDLTLPELDGLEVLDLLAGDAKTREIPTMILSARAHESQIADALARGADAYLKKPFSVEELRATVEQLLGR